MTQLKNIKRNYLTATECKNYFLSVNGNAVEKSFNEVSPSSMSVVKQTETETFNRNIFPFSLEEFGLTQAIKELVSVTLEEHKDIQIDFYSILYGFRFGKEVEQALYKACKTLINSVITQTKAVTIVLEYQNDTLILKSTTNVVKNNASFMVEMVRNQISMVNGNVANNGGETEINVITRIIKL